MAALSHYQSLDRLLDLDLGCLYRGQARDGSSLLIRTLPLPSEQGLPRLKQELELLTRLTADQGLGLLPRPRAVYDRLPLILELEDEGGVPLIRYLTGQPWELALALELGIQLTRALATIHAQQIMLRNLSPLSLLWDEQRCRLTLWDVRLASSPQQSSPPLAHLWHQDGPLAYAAPEHTGRTSFPADCRADLYALGASLYHLLVGTPPFDGLSGVALVHAHLARMPVPPREKNPFIPQALSDVILKLMAKEREERYQSARGLLADLERCQQQLLSHQPLQVEPGARDANPELRLANRLYGRATERRVLLEAFDQVANGGRLLLAVAGYSGVGKSSLVRELCQPVVSRGGIFVSGKFDQVQRKTPYHGFSQALHELCQQLLCEAEPLLAARRETLLARLGRHGRALTELVPSLERIIGPQPPLEWLPAAEAHHRLFSGIQAFLEALACAQQPVVLFVDDWQWADQDSIALLTYLVQAKGLSHLLMLTAYRDNEVDTRHPFHLALDTLRGQGQPVKQLRLHELKASDLGALIADSLGMEVDAVGPLTRLVREKTGGNPFFVRAFLLTLHREQLLTFDPENHGWQWDMAQIARKALSDNIVDLLVRQLSGYPWETQNAIVQAAYLGHTFDLATLSHVTHVPLPRLHKLLEPPRTAQLILPLQEGGASLHSSQVLRFQHDRVQQAAYELVPLPSRPLTHLRIAQSLLSQLPTAERLERIFEVVDHLNVGLSLISQRADRLQALQLNLLAATKARLSTAYETAWAYLVHAQGLLTRLGADYLWHEAYADAWTLHLEMAEVAYLLGDFDAAERHSATLIARAATPLEKAEGRLGRIVRLTLQARYAEAIQEGRLGLSALGLDLPEADLEQARDAEVAQVLTLLEQRKVSDLLQIPPITDPTLRMIGRLLIALGPPCYRARQPLWAVIVPRAVRLILEHGPIPQVSYAFPAFGGLLAYIGGRYALGRAFGETAARLMRDTFTSPGDQAVFWLMMGSSLRHWSAPTDLAIQDYQQAFERGNASGNRQYAAYAFGHEAYCRFFAGGNLLDLQTRVQGWLESSRQWKNQWTVDLLESLELALAALLSDKDQPYDPENPLEQAFITRCQAHGNVQVMCIHQIVKGYVCFILQDFNSARQALSLATPLVYTIATQGLLPWPAFTLLEGLLLLTPSPSPARPVPPQDLARAEALRDQLSQWAENAPTNFGVWASLLDAECHAARSLQGNLLESREETAQALSWRAALGYEETLTRARGQETGLGALLACELALRFWQHRGLLPAAEGYWQRALEVCREWDAAARERQLLALGAESFPHVTPPWPAPPLDPPVANLPSQAILEALASLSREVQRETLLEQILSLVIRHAGAERGVLIMECRGQWQVEADSGWPQGTLGPNVARPLEEAELPVPVVRYVINALEPVLIGPAPLPLRFANDAYIQAATPRSMYCLPLSNLGRLVGVLYLENTLLEGAFSPDRIDWLRVISAQMAISLSNVHVYAHLEERVHERTQALEAANRELERRQAEVVALHQLSHDLQGCPTVETAIHTVRQFLEHWWHADGSIFLQTEHGLMCKEYWGRPPSREWLIGATPPPSCRSRLFQAVQDVLPAACQCPPVRGEVCAPLCTVSECLGLLRLGRLETEELASWQRMGGSLVETLSLTLSNLRLKERLESLSLRDPLTGLFNRRYLEQIFPLELARSQRSREPLAVLLMDIDYFKRVNDTYGHLAGDTVLRGFASFLGAHVRAGDVCCRLGGEEFVVVMSKASGAQALNRANKLLEALRDRPFPVEGVGKLPIRASVGVSVFPEHGATLDLLLEAADRALYTAKRERDRACLAVESGY